MDKERVMQLALERERELNEMRHSFRDDKTSRDFTQQQLSPVAITLYTDILTSFEKIGDYALNIVETTTGVRDKMRKEDKSSSGGVKK